LSELLHVEMAWLSGGSKPAGEGERRFGKVNAIV
jgi:hypothetical protein